MHKIQYFKIKKILFLFFTLSVLLYPHSMRVMPLGDSITYDDSYADTDNPRPAGLRSGYRNYLWYKLEDAEYDVDFVGSRVAGQDIIPKFDPDNEGYPGWTSYDLANKTYDWMQKSKPDIVLLHAGSNDWDESSSGIEKILNEIDRYERDSGSTVTVILARIINRPERYTWISNFNHNIQALANNRINNGDNIVVVDMEYGAGLDYDRDFQDPTHPNNTGYEKMATVWFKALDNMELPPKPSHPRFLADINGDDMTDVIGFGNAGAYVSLSEGDDFETSSLWLNNFGYDQGWRSDTTLRKVADVDRDRLADIVGFGAKGVYVSLSNGSGFDPASLWIDNFGSNQDWTNDKHLRMLSDINGDNMADIVGFGAKGVYVSLSNGPGFDPASLWIDNFGGNQGWSVDFSPYQTQQ